MKTINNITIIGGGGNFGKFMKQELEKVGFQVFTILEETPNEEKQTILDMSNVVIFSVPIRNTIETIKDFVNFRLTPDTLVMDVTGIKSGISEELEKLGTDEFASVHPMLGVSAKSLKGQNIIQTSSEENGGKKWKLLRRLIKKLGGNLRILSETKHDSSMAFIQASPHFLNLVFGNIMTALGFGKDELNLLDNSTFGLQKSTFIRILDGQSGSTWADMEIQNPEFKNDIINKLLSSMESLIKNDVELIKENTGKNCKVTKMKAVSRLLGLIFKDLIQGEHIDLERIKKLSTPNFDDLLKLIDGLDSDSKVELTRKDLLRFIKEFHKLANIVKNGDFKGFEEMFSKLQEKFV